MPQDPQGMIPDFGSGNKLSSPYTLRLRDNITDAWSQFQRRKSAQEMLNIILGKDEEPIRYPTLQEVLLHPGRDYRSPDIRESVSPALEAAFSSALRDYPGAGRLPYSLYEMGPTNDDRFGEFGMLGDMGVKRNYAGKPRTQGDMRRTILHELSHAIGTEDEQLNPKRIGSYDVNNAVLALGEDTRLPLAGLSSLAGFPDNRDINLPLKGAPDYKPEDKYLSYFKKKAPYASKKR